MGFLVSFGGTSQNIDFLFCMDGFHAKGIVLRFLKNVKAPLFEMCIIHTLFDMIDWFVIIVEKSQERKG